jgi:dihydrodipicolinate synthase/N-acetylneuraminate lyase
VHTLPEAIAADDQQAAADVAVDYFEQIAPSVSIPVLIYQAPGTDPTHCVTPESLARIGAKPNVRGIKVSSPDAGYIFDLTRALRGTDCAFITGNECAWLWGLECGSTAVIGQGACLNPQVLKAVQDRLEAGDIDGTREAQAGVNRLVAACPNAVDFFKRYLNEHGYAMGATFRPKGDNPYAEPDRASLTEAEYEAFKRTYEAELAPFE